MLLGVACNNVVSSYTPSNSILSEKKIICEDPFENTCLFAHFNSLNLPKLDTISDWSAWNLRREMTTSIDSAIFPPIAWLRSYYYVSKPYTTKNFVTVIVYNATEGEPFIGIYTIDTSFRIIHSRGLFSTGVGSGGGLDEFRFLYQNYTIWLDLDPGRRFVYFENDSTFTIVDEVSVFHIKDIDTREIRTEIGERIERTYVIDQTGHFVRIDDRSFQTEYSRLFWQEFLRNVD